MKNTFPSPNIHRLRSILTIPGVLMFLSPMALFASDPAELPKVMDDSISTASPERAMYCPIVDQDSLARLKSVRLSPDSLPSGYGFSAFSSSPMFDCTAWWGTFDDPVLTRLETLVQKNNYNLRAMLKRIEASRQMLRQTRAGYYPTVGLMAGYDIDRDSGREASQATDAFTNTFFQLGATVSWEIDIFGRIYEKSKADRASLEATRLEYDGMLLSLEAEVATQYAALLMYKQQLEVAQTHLKTQEDILAVAEARYKAGLVSKLDVAQARSMVSSTRLLMPQYRSNMMSAVNALATLCGISTADVRNMVENSTTPHLSVPLQVGVPADLIRRRPDVAEAEKQIEVLAARLGVAKKDYLPSLTLNATLGTSSHNAKYLFGKNSFNYEINPTLTWTLFDGFAREAGVAEAKAQMEAEIETYNYTLMTALQEVEDAMQNYVSAGRELTLYADVLESSEEVVNLSLERYRHGLTDFTDVANAQITYLQNHTQYASSRANLFNCIVRLYKALGGGFSGLNQ